MLRRVALGRTDVSEELSASFIRVTRICELGKTLAVTSNRHTLRKNTNLTNCVETYAVACRRELSGVLLYVVGSRPVVAFRNETWELNLKEQDYKQGSNIKNLASRSFVKCLPSREEWCLLGCYAVWLL
jgi:hypothetical protein